MTAEKAEAEILLAMLAAVEVDGAKHSGREDQRNDYLRELRAAGVYFSVEAVLGHAPAEGERRECRRAAVRLADRGLLVRVCDGAGRARRLQFTLDGLLRAIELAGDSCIRADVAEGLRRTAWGQDLARALQAAEASGEAAK